VVGNTRAGSNPAFGTNYDQKRRNLQGLRLFIFLALADGSFNVQILEIYHRLKDIFAEKTVSLQAAGKPFT
jgi:hypothetical protein